MSKPIGINVKKIIFVLCFVGFVAGITNFQNYNQQRLSHAISAWQSKIDIAQLKGKSPEEVSAFLSKYSVAQGPYSGLEWVHYKDKAYRQGYILAHAGSGIYYLGLWQPEFWSVEMSFTFDDRNKCQGSYVSATGS